MQIEPEMEPMPACWSPAAALVLGLLASCGAGVAGVAASSGSSGGGSTPALDSFVVESPKVSPCRLRLDASQAVRVGLYYDLGQGAGEQAMTELDGVAGNEVDLPDSEVTLTWDFAAELPRGAGFTENVRLMAKRGGSVISGGELALVPGLGNDVPVVHSVDSKPTDPANPEESAGNVEVRILVSDTSSDVVSLEVEWRRPSDAPDDWKTATAAGVFPEGIETSPEPGVELSFFWATNVDLQDGDDDVLLRVTPDDRTLDSSGMPVGEGEPLESRLVHIDNNAPPIVQLDSGPLILNPDERRGIPIPFRVIDEEGDLVEVTFQWRREGEEFPSLDRDRNGKIENAEVDAILADPVLRQEHHVCTPYPHYAKGRVVPIDEDTVRLPELASSESWILASGIVGKTLELLRPSSIPAPITPTWRSNPLVSPIAALPVGDGLTALVLDVPGTGRLREIELATGAVAREIAALGPGIPGAMTFERGEKAVLVALDDAGTWRIERVELASGALTDLIVSDGIEPAPVRGIASLGTNAAVFTAGSSLLHLDYRDPLAPQLGTLLADLATPWGVVVDPLSPDRIFVSERDANRVLAIELGSHGKLPVVVKTADLQPGTLDQPEALALERHGSRMLIVTSAPGGGRELLGLDLGATGGNRSFPIGEPTATDVASVATGSDELRLLSLPASNELLGAGGMEQRRAITTHSTSSQDVSVERLLDPVPSSGQPWRLSEEARLRASARGAAGRFVWDSIDAHSGFIFVRATARDDEYGTAADGAAPKGVRAGLEVDPLVLGGLGTTNSPSSVAAADFDGDGDQDIVSANRGGDNLTVFFQLAPGSFGDTPATLGGPTTIRAPCSVAGADLDGDGDQDIVEGNYGDTFGAGSVLKVFFQLSPGSFGDTPLRLGSPTRTNRPCSVAAPDLDGDGDQDIVSANYEGDNLTIFFQRSPGSFAASPLTLDGAGLMRDPRSVVASDLDGDGDLDLVSASSFFNNLTAFLQVSPGTFTDAPLVVGGLPWTSTPYAVTASDLDGDGDQDLVSANLDSDNLTAFLQHSSGTFGYFPLVLGGFPRTINPISVSATDFDGDGDQDLLSANLGDSGAGSNLTVFLQESPGSFGAAPLVLGGPGTTNLPTSVAAADLDGDGDQDLVSANYSGNDLTIFLQPSSGSFEASPLDLGGLLTTGAPASVAAADLDGDGDQDLVSANSGGNNLTAFFQLSPRSFGASPLVLGAFPTTYSPASVAAADLDGDGDQDLVSANGSGNADGFGNNLLVFLKRSPGNFEFPRALGGYTTTTGPVSVTAADLDGDGDQDLVSANSRGSNLTVFSQLSPGGFGFSPLTLGGPGTTDEPRSVAAADLDGDGDLDLVSANERGQNLTVFFQVPSGGFQAAPLTLGGSGTTRFPVSVAAADLDGDGDQDLVSANESGHNLTVFFQISPGSFGASPLTFGDSTTTYGPNSVAAADLDGDGDQDLVSANEFGNNLAVFLQLSPGRFADSPLALGGLPATNRPISVAVADLDGDGDQDLLSANSFGGNNLTVFFGGR